MTPPESTASPSQQLLDDAIRAFTAAARLDSGPDFAEFVTLTIAAAMANIGSVEKALARRSGSWEASQVRDMVRSTVGEEMSTLLEHRTEPVRIVVRPDETLSDLGYWQLYTDDEADLQRRHDALGLPAVTRHPDGSVSGDSTPWTDAQEAAAEAVNVLVDEVAELQAQDIADYGAALSEAVRVAAGTLFPTLPVQVEVTADLDWNHEADTDDELTWSILEMAFGTAPLPSSGIAPQNYPTGVAIARAEREAGRTPLQRIARTTDTTSTSNADED